MSEVNPEVVAEADIAFLEMTQDRYLMGAEKYGPVRYLEIDSIQMALEEVADLANYARFTWIKLWLLQQKLNQTPVVPKQRPPILGKDSVQNPHTGG